MSSDFGHIIGMFQTNTDLVKKATEGIPPNQWVQTPGESSNHMLWILGHLIWCRGNILKTLGAEGAAPWGSLFARGTKPASTDHYPSIEEIRKTWVDLTDRLVAGLSNVPAEVLAKPHDKPTFDGKTGGFIAFLAFHETYHAGQLGYLRKWLGHGQAVG
jgi:uncharacterized damage-inducible protein DinB